MSFRDCGIYWSRIFHARIRKFCQRGSNFDNAILYFELETVLKFYNLKAWLLQFKCVLQRCRIAVSVMFHFPAVPWVDLWSVIVVFFYRPPNTKFSSHN